MTAVAPQEREGDEVNKTERGEWEGGECSLPQRAVLQRILCFSSSRKCLSSRKMRGIYGDTVTFLPPPRGEGLRCDILASHGSVRYSMSIGNSRPLQASIDRMLRGTPLFLPLHACIILARSQSLSNWQIRYCSLLTRFFLRPGDRSRRASSRNVCVCVCPLPWYMWLLRGRGSIIAQEIKST